MRFLGALTGASGFATSSATGISGPLAIPAGVKRVYLQPSASGLYFEIGSTGLTVTPTSSDRGAQLQGGLNGPFAVPGVSAGTVVSIFSNNGVVSVRVFGVS